VAGISESTNWNYTDPGSIILEANHEISPYVVLSHTKVFEVPGAGTYTYYAMAERAYEENGNGFFYVYTNFHGRFYPDEDANIIEHKPVLRDNMNLNGNLTILDSINIDVVKPGQVEIRFDGYLQSPAGHSILLAANDTEFYELKEGSVILETGNATPDRHTFVHSRVFDVLPGSHTYYIMAENYSNTGTVNVDLHGDFVVKYYEENIISAVENISKLPFECWPNPANDLINLQFENNFENAELSIFNGQGHLIKLEKNMVSGNKVDITSLPAGIYIIVLSNGYQQGFSKLVKL
jgi:hypothetical protein